MTDVSLDPLAAAVAGLIAGLVMETPAYLQRALHLPLRQDVFSEGGLLLGVRGRAQRLVGYLGHAGLSAVIALLYVVLFHTVAALDHLMAWGVLGGLVHFAVGGLVVAGVFPVVDPDSAAAGLRGVGFAYARYGRRDVLTFLAGHVGFGSLLGLLYSGLHPALGIPAAL